MRTYDVYVKSVSVTGSGEPATVIRRSSSENPDDAIFNLREKGDYIPERGDVITRCVEVDRFFGKANQ